jgi:alpha-glucosidase
MWWRNAVIYEIYVRSFADANGDGVGDLPGVVGHLDYLSWLGVDAIWLTPIMSSPGADHGYDVYDYCDVDPLLGTLSDVDRLVREADRRGIKVLLDLVPNHTSDQHPWFRDPVLRERYYVWSDQPNNWVGTFQQLMWTRDAASGRYYLHSYLPEQPDLNWWDDGVRAEFDRILRFWFDRGIAGFRIDACYIIVKDRHLRDNPAAGPDDHLWDRNRGQCPVWNAHRPEVHEVLRRWRAVATEYQPERLLMGAVRPRHAVEHPVSRRRRGTRGLCGDRRPGTCPGPATEPQRLPHAAPGDAEGGCAHRAPGLPLLLRRGCPRLLGRHLSQWPGCLDRDGRDRVRRLLGW